MGRKVGERWGRGEMEERCMVGEMKVTICEVSKTGRKVGERWGQLRERCRLG